MDLTFQVPMQYCSLQHWTLLLSPITSTAGYCFCFGSIPSFFLELFLHWPPVSYWATTDLRSSSFSVLSLLPFHTIHGVFKTRILNWLAIPFSSGPHFVRTLHHDPPIWVALYGITHSLTELDKAAVQVISLFSFLWLWFSFCLILKEMGIPDHLTCLLRNLYAGQEATVRNGHGTTDWFQIGKGVRWGCILSPCLFTLYAEYIMRNTGLEKHKLESRLPGEISITSDMQMTPLLWQKVKRS